MISTRRIRLKVFFEGLVFRRWCHVQCFRLANIFVAQSYYVLHPADAPFHWLTLGYGLFVDDKPLVTQVPAPLFIIANSIALQPTQEDSESSGYEVDTRHPDMPHNAKGVTRFGIVAGSKHTSWA